MRETEEYKQIIKSIDRLIKMQSENGRNYDPYGLGMLNGMILIKSVLTDEDPVFMDAYKKWEKNEPSCKENK
jgi:hypothetical protein